MKVLLGHSDAKNHRRSNAAFKKEMAMPAILISVFQLLFTNESNVLSSRFWTDLIKSIIQMLQNIILNRLEMSFRKKMHYKHAINDMIFCSDMVLLVCMNGS